MLTAIWLVGRTNLSHLVSLFIGIASNVKSSSISILTCSMMARILAGEQDRRRLSLTSYGLLHPAPIRNPDLIRGVAGDKNRVGPGTIGVCAKRVPSSFGFKGQNGLGGPAVVPFTSAVQCYQDGRQLASISASGLISSRIDSRFRLIDYITVEFHHESNRRTR